MNQEPKFHLGEAVMVRCPSRPESNTDKTIVTEVRHMDNKRMIAAQTREEVIINGFYYRTEHMTGVIESGYFKETSLQKLPPNDVIEWADCEFKPTEVDA